MGKRKTGQKTVKKPLCAPICTALNLQGRLKSWNFFDLVLFGLPARFSLCFMSCSWGLCSQREIHNKSWAHSICPSIERRKIRMKSFSECSQIKVKSKKVTALRVDFCFVLLWPAVCEGYMCKKTGASEQNFSSQCFSCSWVLQDTLSAQLVLEFLTIFPGKWDSMCSVLRVCGCRCGHASGCKQPFKRRQRWGLLAPCASHTRVNHLCCHSN